MKTVLMTSLLAFSLAFISPIAGAQTIKAGANYQALSQPVPTSTADGKIEVIEFFWYACPHCFAFQPYLDKWTQKDKPDNVEFVRVPVANGFRFAKIYAKAFYTEKALGLVDQLHDAFFNEIHINHKMLNNKDAIQAFFVKHGVDAKTFNETWNSFAVAMDVKKAGNLQKSYDVMGVPMMAVNGQYIATLGHGQDDKGLLKTVDFLVKKLSKSPQ